MFFQSIVTGTAPQPIPGDISLLRPALAKLLSDASGAVERDSGTARSCIAQALALLRRDNAPADQDPLLPRRCGLAPWQMKRVKTYIEEHLDEPIRVSELAALSRLSVSYFSGAFKRSFGSSVQTFLAHRRVERAQMLMLSTDQSLCKIALASGYCDQAHLCRQFRRITGSTPRSWRQEHIQQPFVRESQRPSMGL